MSIHQHATIEDTVYFWFGANNTSGSGADGATPVYDVRLAGGAAGLAPVVSGAATLLTHGDFPPGCHEIAIVAGVGTGTGFAANATYAVFCTLLVDSQNPTGFAGSFTLAPIVANMKEVDGTAAIAAAIKSIFGGTGIADDIDIQMRSLTITNDAGVGFAITGTDDGLSCTGTAGSGVKMMSSGGGGHGLEATGDIAGHGAIFTGVTTGEGVRMVGGNAGNGLEIISENAVALRLDGDTFGLQATGVAGPGGSFVATAGNNDGLIVTGFGTGKDFNATSLGWLNDTAIGNFEDQYDGTGLLGDTFPLRQDQGASIAGGLAVKSNMTSVTVIQGSQQNLSNTNASNNTRWTGDDDGAGAEFIFLCTPADTTAEPGDLHSEGYYDEPSGSSNGATISVYNFQSAAWEAHVTLSNSNADETHDVSLTHANGAPGSGTLETVAYTIGDVLIKVEQDTQETGNACLLIDRMYVGFISSALTQAEITGGAYPLDTDGNGRIRIVDGTGAGELDTTSGKVTLADGAQGGSSTVLTLSQLVISGSHAGGTIDIDNSGGAGLNIDSSVTDGVVIGAGGGGDGVVASGHGAGAGFYMAGGGAAGSLGLLIAEGLSIDTVDVTGTTALTGAVTMTGGLVADITGAISEATILGTNGLQQVAQVTSQTSGTVWFVDDDGDNADGLSPATAFTNVKTTIEAASAGDVVLIGPGTYALGNNVIGIPAGVKVVGSGIDTTVITSTQVSVIIKPGDNTEFSDCTVQGIAAAGEFQFPYGTHEDHGKSAFTNAVIRRVKLIAEADCFYVRHSTACTCLAEDIICESNFDSVVLFTGDHVVTMIHPIIKSVGPNAITNRAQGVDVRRGTLYLFEPEIYVAGETDTHTGIRAEGVNAVVVAINPKMYVSPDAINSSSILQNDGATIVIAGGEYDRSMESGTILKASAFDSAGVASPTAGSAASVVADWLNGGRLDLLLDAVKATTDKLDTTVVQDGAVWDFTEAALAAAPGGGTVDANLIQIEGHALNGTGTQIADGFEHWFDVATPSKTMNDAGIAGSGLTAADVWGYTSRQLTANGVDLIVIETGTNMRQAVALIGANCVGLISGAGGTTVVCAGIGVATTRTSTTTDVDGNRLAVALTRPA